MALTFKDSFSQRYYVTGRDEGGVYVEQAQCPGCGSGGARVEQDPKHPEKWTVSCRVCRLQWKFQDGEPVTDPKPIKPGQPTRRR